MSETYSPPQIAPTPQHVEWASQTWPLGPVVLEVEGKADQWAMTALSRGLVRKGLKEPVAGAPGVPHTVVRLTEDAPTCALLAERCRRSFGDECTPERLGTQGYILEVHDEGAARRVTIAASTGTGLAYGVGTFLQLIEVTHTAPMLHGACIFDYPGVELRAYGGSAPLDRVAELRYTLCRGGRTAEEIEQMRLHHIEPWIMVHPSRAVAGMPGLCYSDPAAVEHAIAPLVEAAKRGVRWLGLSFDDIDLRLAYPDDVERYWTIGRAHAAFINHTLRRLREIDPEVQLTVIPIVYANNWLPGTWVYATNETEIYDYLTTLGKQVDPSVIFVWTGESVESTAMTDDDIAQWTELVGRKPLVFENTPTGDLTDFGALKFRTPNAGELLAGWLYVSRGPQAEIAEITTAEYLWNPRAYDPQAAQRRAIRELVGAQAAPAMEKLVSVFSYGDNPRYRHPIWREGRMLEVADPTDGELAEFYVNRLQTISEALPVLERLAPDVPVYTAIRKIALDSVDVARAYLETYIMLKSAEQGDLQGAIEAGDRAEALYQEWTRFSAGSTDLYEPTERRDAITYIEQIGVARRLRALRRGGDAPISWVAPKEHHEVRHGRPCVVFRKEGDRVEVNIRANGRRQWLVFTALGEENPPVRVEMNGSFISVPPGIWKPDRWRSAAVPIPAEEGTRRVVLTATGDTDWVLARLAIVSNPSPAQLLHATRSSAELGQFDRLREPDRLLVTAETPQVTGRMAIRADIELVRGASGRFFDLSDDRRIGQTFHLPPEGKHPIPPKDPIHLIARESSDGDFLHGVGVMFTQQGETPLRLTLWRWDRSVQRTVENTANRIGEAVGQPGIPGESSHHWMFFPLGAELDFGATYYFELTAPEGWKGWRLRPAFGWYGYRGDPTRSAYVDGEIARGMDIPFRTYVCDVYDASWKE